MSRTDPILASFAPVIQPHSRIIDIGAGNGHLARELAQQCGARVTLVDVVPYNRTDLGLIVCDSRTLSFADASFDYAVLSFVLHHSPDPDAILREALRVSDRVLVIENDVPGRMRGALTRVVDSAPHLRYGTPPCYFTQPRSSWLRWLKQHPVQSRLLGEFSLGLFGFFRCFTVLLCKE